MDEEPIIRDPDVPGSKSGGGRTGGGTPPPGGGFGGGFGGGGSGFFGSERGMPMGDFFGAMNAWPKRRIVMGPNGPISVASSPMGTDTVPAMLTPGEGVLNVGAMAEPGMEDFMQAANERGAARMAEGGVVAEPLDRAMLMKLLRLLLDDGEGEVQGFAWGGMVRPQAGGMRQQALGAPRMPAGGLPGGGTTFGASPRPGAAPGAAYTPTRNRYRQTGALTPGGTGASQVPGTDPWGGDPLAPGSQNPGDEWMARISQMLRDAGQFGAFSPQGSAGLLDAVRSEAMGNADALRRRSATNASLLGLDPGQRGAYAMQSDLNTQGGVANALNSAVREQLLGQQQFQQNMLGKFADANMQAWLARLASWMKGG